jgi:hypothetical protein
MSWLRRQWARARGRLSDEQRAELEAEGVELIEEGLGGWVDYRRYRAPGKRFHGKRVTTRGAIAITRRRLVVVWVGEFERLEVPFDAPAPASLSVAAEEGLVRFAFEAADFDPRCSGEVEVRLVTGSAQRVADWVSALGAAS